MMYRKGPLTLPAYMAMVYISNDEYAGGVFIEQKARTTSQFEFESDAVNKAIREIMTNGILINGTNKNVYYPARVIERIEIVEGTITYTLEDKKVNKTFTPKPSIHA